MTNQFDFTNDEWDQIAITPVLVGAAVARAAPSGFIGGLKEARTLAENVRSRNRYQERIEENPARALIAEVRAGELKEKLERMTAGDPLTAEQLADAAAEACTATGKILAERATPAEAKGYREWVFGIAQRVAEAAKEGGVRVSPPEAALIDRLVAAFDGESEA